MGGFVYGSRGLSVDRTAPEAAQTGEQLVNTLRDSANFDADDQDIPDRSTSGTSSTSGLSERYGNLSRKQKLAGAVAVGALVVVGSN